MSGCVRERPPQNCDGLSFYDRICSMLISSRSTSVSGLFCSLKIIWMTAGWGQCLRELHSLLIYMSWQWRYSVEAISNFHCLHCLSFHRCLFTGKLLIEDSAGSLCVCMRVVFFLMLPWKSCVSFRRDRCNYRQRGVICYSLIRDLHDLVEADSFK